MDISSQFRVSGFPEIGLNERAPVEGRDRRQHSSETADMSPGDFPCSTRASRPADDRIDVDRMGPGALARPGDAAGSAEVGLELRAAVPGGRGRQASMIGPRYEKFRRQNEPAPDFGHPAICDNASRTRPRRIRCIQRRILRYFCIRIDNWGRSMKSLTTIVALTCLIGGAAYAETPLERGSYLVNTIMTCGNCHSPKGPPSAVAGKDFSGFTRFDVPGAFDVTAPNITSDKQTGIGAWSAADLEKLLLTGVRPNGTAIAIMPTGFYGILLPSDLDAIVTYVQSLAPVSNKVPDPIYKIAIRQEVFPGAEKPIDPALLKDNVERGFYLASIGHCMECHTPREKGELDFDRTGAGGQGFPGPWGISVSSNITSSKTHGIGTWTDAEIKRAITHGVDKDGKQLSPPMGFSYYAQMKDSDLDDLIAWLRTAPPKE
jgi:mono/diheme cytochrome c family protein